MIFALVYLIKQCKHIWDQSILNLSVPESFCINEHGFALFHLMEQSMHIWDQSMEFKMNSITSSAVLLAFRNFPGKPLAFSIVGSGGALFVLYFQEHIKQR